MNRARVAALLRELADEFDSSRDSDATDERPSEPRPRARRLCARPEGQSDEIASARARRLLREHGWTQVKR